MRTFRRHLVAWTAAVLAFAVSGAGTDARFFSLARAQAAPDVTAHELFQQGATKFRSGDFRAALELFEKAHALDPHPTLLYNIARAHEGLGELDEAIGAYERYLSSDSSASDRGAVEQRIVTIKKQVGERNELVRRAKELEDARAREAKRKAPAPQPARSANAIPWIVAGIGVVGAAAGGVLLGVAGSTYSDAEREPTASRARELEANARTLNTAGLVTVSAGGVIAVVAVAFGIIDVTSLRKSNSAAAVGWTF